MGSDLWGVIKKDHASHTEVLLSIAKELQKTRDRLLGILSTHRPPQHTKSIDHVP